MFIFLLSLCCNEHVLFLIWNGGKQFDGFCWKHIFFQIEIAKGDEGITEMLKEMCQDKTGHHGLREESDEMKARVVELALEGGFIDEVRYYFEYFPFHSSKFQCIEHKIR